MKLWLLTRPLFDYPDPYRSLSSHALHRRHRNGLFIRGPYLPGRELRLTHPQPSRQRCILLFHLHLYAHWTGPVLRLLPIQRNMKHWGGSAAVGYNNRLCWVRPALGTDVILRCHRNYKPIVRSALRG